MNNATPYGADKRYTITVDGELVTNTDDQDLAVDVVVALHKGNTKWEQIKIVDRDYTGEETRLE